MIHREGSCALIDEVTDDNGFTDEVIDEGRDSKIRVDDRVDRGNI